MDLAVAQKAACGAAQSPVVDALVTAAARVRSAEWKAAATAMVSLLVENGKTLTGLEVACSLHEGDTMKETKARISVVLEKMEIDAADLQGLATTADQLLVRLRTLARSSEPCQTNARYPIRPRTRRIL